MKVYIKVDKQEFIQNTSKYIKWAEDSGQPLIITYHNHPGLTLMAIKPKYISDLSGSVNIKIHGDINEHELPNL